MNFGQAEDFLQLRVVVDIVMGVARARDAGIRRDATVCGGFEFLIVKDEKEASEGAVGPEVFVGAASSHGTFILFKRRWRFSSSRP